MRTIAYRGKSMERAVINKKLNLLKGFACIGLIFIHIEFPGLFGKIVADISAFAVPAFYMISGYYSYGKNSEVIRKRMKKIAVIFLIGYILFFVYSVTLAWSHHNIAGWFAENYNWKTPVKYIVFCTVDFGIPLWYLIAMLEVYAVWLIVIKRNKEKDALKLIPLLFILQIILITYCKTMHLSWYWKTNFLTRAMPWFLLGQYMRSEKVSKMNKYKLLLIALAGCLIVIAPTVFKLPLGLMTIGYIPLVFGLFGLCLKEPGKSICRPIEFIGKELSMYVYLFHGMIRGVVFFLLASVLKTDEKLSMWLRPVAALIITVLLSLAVYCLKRLILKRKNALSAGHDA